MKRLYKVTVTHESLVIAESQRDAERYAMDIVRDTDADARAFRLFAMPLSSIDLNSIPFGDDDYRTVAQLRDEGLLDYLTSKENAK